MRLAHIIVCKTSSPGKLLSTIPHQPDSYWYSFLHSQSSQSEGELESHAEATNGNFFDYGFDRGRARSWNQGIKLGLEAGCEAFLLLSDDVFFYRDGYLAYRNTIEALRIISKTVALVFANGYETNGGETEAVMPQQFACCAVMREAVEAIGFFDEALGSTFTKDFETRCAKAGLTNHLDKRCLIERRSSIDNGPDIHCSGDEYSASDGDGPSLSLSVRAEISRWAAEEVADSGVARLSEAQIEALAAKYRGVYIYDISQSGIKIRAKPNGVEGLSGRAHIYRDLLQRVAKKLRAKDFSIALQVEDDAIETKDLPIFSFQKKANSANILLPDPDFYSSNHYWDFDSIAIPDDEKFEDKVPRAIFVGSTSGAGRITKKSLDNDVVPRVRLARFAKAYSELEVYLPLIVQADAEAEAILREEGFGQTIWQWKEQIRYRFIISMDGNGATCSRVYLALRSNCVLLKYESDNALYYFRGLKSGKHYVNIVSDSELISLLRDDQEQYGIISAESKRFARDYLSRDALDFYVERLMGEYVKA